MRASSVTIKAAGMAFNQRKQVQYLQGEICKDGRVQADINSPSTAGARLLPAP